MMVAWWLSWKQWCISEDEMAVVYVLLKYSDVCTMMTVLFWHWWQWHTSSILEPLTVEWSDWQNLHWHVWRSNETFHDISHDDEWWHNGQIYDVDLPANDLNDAWMEDASLMLWCCISYDDSLPEFEESYLLIMMMSCWWRWCTRANPCSSCMMTWQWPAGFLIWLMNRNDEQRW